MEVHQCECAICQRGEDAGVMAHHRHINLVLSRLEEAERRWNVASLSSGPGAPSDGVLAQISGLSEKTVARGRHELEANLDEFLCVVDVVRERAIELGYAAEQLRRPTWSIRTPNPPYAMRFWYANGSFSSSTTARNGPVASWTCCWT
jgi:hypothetical protein